MAFAQLAAGVQPCLELTLTEMVLGVSQRLGDAAGNSHGGGLPPRDW